MIFVTAPFLAFALSWGACLWIAATLALEVEAQVQTKRWLAAGRLSRSQRVRVLMRVFWVTIAWSAGPVALYLARDGQFRLAGLMWASALMLYTAAFSYRSLAYSALGGAAQAGLFVIAPSTLVGHDSPLPIAVLAGFLFVYAAFALHAGFSNHQRDRDLRRTRRKLVREAEVAHHLACHDQLTGLVNRRQLVQHLTHAIAHADRHSGEVALLLIDLDRFKLVNDTYGHGCGDELLRAVAQRLTRSCRASDICARLGGDEFVVLAQTCNAREAAAIAQRILKALAEPLHLTEVTVHSGGSVGVSIYAGGQGADSSLLRQADLALYRVKERGRNAFCFFEPEMDHTAQARRGLEIDLRQAIGANAISVVYQPQFDGETMVGVEALARWAHPVRGSVSPGVFIALAEECGLIEELGMYIIRQAFADSFRWPGMRTAINLSPVQLRAPNFLPELQRLMESTGVPAERIEFEITESVLLSDEIQTQHGVASLRALGFGVALDDFGTGFSSLSYLRKFPIDRIKIDRSFIASLPDDKVSDAIVRSLVSLCDALKLDVLAEGVETLAQRDALSSAGCNSFQGFVLGEPMAADDISATVGVTRVARRFAVGY